MMITVLTVSYTSYGVGTIGVCQKVQHFVARDIFRKIQYINIELLYY